MNDFRDQLRLAEYSSLRAELAQGKQFIFERPLLIIVAAGVATAQLVDNATLVLLPFPLVAFLLFNFVFTVNRLQSMARIIAYIDAVLESETDIEWVGWETSLRRHRTWLNTHTADEHSEVLCRRMNRDAIPDALTFYPHLLTLHLATVSLAVAGSAYLLAQAPDGDRVAWFLATALLSIAFVAVCSFPYHPHKMRETVETQRALWLEVLQSPEAE